MHKLQREEAILLSLKKLDYLSRSQIQKLHQLGGERNARRVLNNMSEYLSSFRDVENIYYLNKAGRERVGSHVARHKTNQVGHYLMRNDMYIHYRPTEWKNEMKVTVQGEGMVSIITDAYFEYKQRLHFLEVDHLQHMQKNYEKVEKYRKIKDTGVYQDRYKYFPRLVWVTLTENRKEQLVKWCEGLDTKVFTWDEIK